MKLPRKRVAAGVVAAVALAGSTAAGVVGHVVDIDEPVESAALAGPVHALVVLPKGYETSRRRYPVIYFLHGLPASSSAYLGSRWLERAVAAAGPSILVEPQGARAGDADPEYLDWGPGRDWATFVTRELPHYVDTHFRTIASRRGRALIGLSAGGYGAAMLGVRNLDEFSVIESWSGYFHATDPTGTKAIDGGPAANVHTLVPGLAADVERRPTFIAFYVGRGDGRFLSENVEFDRELTQAGVPHVFEVYGGGHEVAVWQRHAAGWLRLALGHLAAPPS